LSYEDFIGNNVFFILAAFSKHCNEHWSHEYLSWESRNLQFEHWVIWNSLCYHCLQADTTGYILPYLQKPKTTWDQSDVQLRVWEIRCPVSLLLLLFSSSKGFNGFDMQKCLLHFFCIQFCSLKSLGVSLASWSCSDQEFLTLLLHTHFSLWKEGSVRVVIALKL
jgi:hypothetical protein